jgi:hypothetical protein
MNNHERENYGWGIVQDMIEREVNAAFKLRKPPKKEIKYNMEHYEKYKSK